MEHREFGQTPAGETVHLFTLKSSGGLVARIMNYGGIVTELHVPDKDGNLADVVLGFDSLAPYLAKHPYFGAIIGRVAGRIGGASFFRGRRIYPLTRNEGPNHLHGGAKGFHARLWSAGVKKNPDGDVLRLTYLSRDGEEGYPGNLKVAVTYALLGNELRIEYEAKCDQATPFSPTHHSYFNLGGEGSGDIGGHHLHIAAETYAPVDEAFIATGERRSVAGEANDFQVPVVLGSRMEELFGRHGDNYFLTRKEPGFVLAALAGHPESGRIMEVWTTESCVQFFTGVGLDGSLVGKRGKPYLPFAGFCLECQGFPGAVRHKGFDSIILEPGATYRQTTVYRFLTKG